MHRLRISDEEIIIISNGLKLLVDKIGYVQDSAEKLLIWRTFQRFRRLAENLKWSNPRDKIFPRPRRRIYHDEIVQEFRKEMSP